MSHLNITLRQLRTFSVASELLNFHEVADKLFLTQPAVSQQMKQLESVLDVKLFDHVGRGLALTEDAKVLLEYVQSILDDVDRLEAFLAEKKKAE